MRRYNVTERGAFVKHIVPRQGKASVLGSVFQEKIRHHPRAVLKLGDVSGRILSIRTNHVATQEVRRRENNLIRMKPDYVRPLVIDGDDIYAGSPVRISGNNLGCREPQSDFGFHFLVKVRNETAVSLGPGHQGPRFGAGPGYPRTKVKQSRPGARLIDRQSIIIAAAIINQPTKPLRPPPPALEPFGHRHLVE